MTRKNRGIRHLAGLVILAVGLGTTACSSIDVSTDEGIKEAITKREGLDKAIPKISGMLTKPDKLKEFVPELVDLYMSDNNAFDREVIQALAVTGDPRANQAFMRAAKSDDDKQVMDAARGVRLTADPSVMSELLQIYSKQINPEVKRVILEIGMSVKAQELSDLAQKVLNGNVDETPFNLLRTSCDVLAYQKDVKAVDTLMRVVYHQDGVGRTLTANCTRALLALPRDVVAPVLLKAYKLENTDLMAYVDKHPDTLTPESIRNNTVNALALYRYQEAVEPILDYIGNTRTIPVPGTLAIRPADDPAWQMWASLVGVAAQSSLFALNDLGIKDNPRAKQILMDIFNWTTAYKAKFKNAIELTGTTNIEVSQRVNAFRILRENDLITTDEVVKMIETLKGEEFQDQKKWRPFARASIATDMITYCAVTSKPGDHDKIWRAFKEMKEPCADENACYGYEDDNGNKVAGNMELCAGEFCVPAQSNTEKAKADHYNDAISQRIEDVEAAFNLADTANLNPEKYSEILKQENLSGYELAKIMYELGLSNDHKYFDQICDNYKRLDVFGQLYGTKALAQLGTKADVPKIEELIKTLASDMNQIQYLTAKPNLEGLITTLNCK